MIRQAAERGGALMGRWRLTTPRAFLYQVARSLSCLVGRRTAPMHVSHAWIAEYYRQRRSR